MKLFGSGKENGEVCTKVAAFDLQQGKKGLLPDVMGFIKYFVALASPEISQIAFQSDKTPQCVWEPEGEIVIMDEVSRSGSLFASYESL